VAVTRISAWSRRAVAGAVLAACAFAPPSSGKDLAGVVDPAVKLEIQYAEGLQKWGMPDYAQIVLDRLRARHPEAEGLVKVIAVEGMLQLGRFDEVRAIIAREPDQNSQGAWALKLALADGYYAWGEYGKARAIYDSLLEAFPKQPPAGLKDFFLNSVYKYAQMQLLLNDRKGALNAYKRLEQAIPREDEERQHIRRQVQGETGDLLVNMAEGADPKDRAAYLKQVRDIANQLMWVQDLWFGKSIVMLAHVEMIEGNLDKAQSLIDEFASQLIQMDETLRQQEAETDEPLSKLSPMAECRYMLGVMMQDKAERLMAANGPREQIITLLAGKLRGGARSNGALQHFYTVFAKYPETSWAADAGTRAEQVRQALIKMGAEIKITIDPEQMTRIQRMQFQGARALFNQQRFAEAVEGYLKVLGLFPEQEMSVKVLPELAECYIETGEEIYAQTVTRYLAERFARHPALMVDAGDGVVNVAEAYGVRKRPVEREEAYDLFFAHFKDHPRTAGILFRFGDKLSLQKDYAAALKYYAQVAENYPDSPLYLDALSKMAYCQSEMGEHMAEVKTLDLYAKALEKGGRPRPEAAAVKFRLAGAYRKLGPKYLPSALNRYIELVQMLSDPKNPYQASAEDAERNRTILEASMFQKGICYSMLDAPPEKAPGYRALAVRSLEELVQASPKSQFAPAALSRIGTLYTVLEKPAEAQAAFRRLQQDHPDTPEARNADFMLGTILLEMNMRQQAITVFKRMFSGEGRFSEGQILSAATELLKAGENEIALEGFQRIVGSRERGVREPALLRKGKALVALKRFAEGLEALESLMSEFPQSGFTVEASLRISTACSELGREESDPARRFAVYNRAVDAINRARRFAKEPGVRARLDLEVGRLYARKAEAERKFGAKDKAEEATDNAMASYQSLMLLADATDPEVRPHIEDAYNECWPLVIARERWEDVIHDAVSYQKMFRGGKYALEARKWAGQAQRALLSAGKKVPGGVEGTDVTVATDEAGKPDEAGKTAHAGKPDEAGKTNEAGATNELPPAERAAAAGGAAPGEGDAP